MPKPSSPCSVSDVFSLPPTADSTYQVDGCTDIKQYAVYVEILNAPAGAKPVDYALNLIVSSPTGETWRESTLPDGFKASWLWGNGSDTMAPGTWTFTINNVCNNRLRVNLTAGGN